MVSPASASLCLIPSPPLPPPSATSVIQIPLIPNSSNQLIVLKSSRRDALSLSLSLLSLIPSLSFPSAATAFGISGPKDWLREQKKKASKFLLAPIEASRSSLNNAYLLLTKVAEDTKKERLEEIQGLFRSAARDCVVEDRNSFVAFQANTGVEVCTFKLLVKNASSLLDDKDPVKLGAEAMLNDLIRSFTMLSGTTNEADIQIASDREKVMDALVDTLSSLDNFEKVDIYGCIQGWTALFATFQLDEPQACTKYKRQQGVPLSGSVCKDLGKLRSLLNRFNGSGIRPKLASGSPN